MPLERKLTGVELLTAAAAVNQPLDATVAGLTDAVVVVAAGELTGMVTALDVLGASDGTPSNVAVIA